MPKLAGHWVAKRVGIVEHYKNMTVGEIVLFDLYLLLADKKTSECWLTIRQIQKLIPIKKETIIRAKKQLIERGWIKKIGKSGIWIAKLFRFDGYKKVSNGERNIREQEKRKVSNGERNIREQEKRKVSNGERKVSNGERKGVKWGTTSIIDERKKVPSAFDNAGQTENPFYLTRKKKKLKGKKLTWFLEFWKTFDYQRGKAEAADAWLEIVDFNNDLFQTILNGAKQETLRRPALKTKGKTPKMAQGWLSGKRWEDYGSTSQSYQFR